MQWMDLSNIGMSVKLWWLQSGEECKSNLSRVAFVWISLLSQDTLIVFVLVLLPVLEVKAEVPQPNRLLPPQESTDRSVTILHVYVDLRLVWTVNVCMHLSTLTTFVLIQCSWSFLRPSEQRYYTQLGKIVRNTQNAIAELHQQQEFLPLVDVFRSSLDEVCTYMYTCMYI